MAWKINPFRLVRRGMQPARVQWVPEVQPEGYRPAPPPQTNDMTNYSYIKPEYHPYSEHRCPEKDCEYYSE